MTGEVERKWKTHTEVFHWKLKKFSSLDDGVDSCCESPQFCFDSRSWMLFCYPNGRKENQSEGDVVLYLILSDRSKFFPPFEMRYSVGIRTEKGGTELRQSGSQTFDHTFSPAFVRVIERSELLRRRDELLPQDVLTIALTMKLEDGSSETESVPFDPNHEILSPDYSQLLEDQLLPDVKLKCAERTFSAHRAVLAARSEVFAAMFHHDTVESETGVVDVTDLDAPVLELFIRCVYTGKIQDLPEDLLPGVYAACDKYAMHSLKKACSHQMIAGLTEDNCVSFLTFADAHSDAPFKQQVVSFICGHEAILHSEVWLSFAKMHMELSNEVYNSYFRSKSRTSVDSGPSFSGDGAKDELDRPAKRRKFCR